MGISIPEIKGYVSWPLLSSCDHVAKFCPARGSFHDFQEACCKGEAFVLLLIPLLICSMDMMTTAVTHRWLPWPSWTMRWVWECKSHLGRDLRSSRLGCPNKENPDLVTWKADDFLHIKWAFPAMGSFPPVIQGLRLMMTLSSVFCGFHGDSGHYHPAKGKVGKEWKARIIDLLLGKRGGNSFLLTYHWQELYHMAKSS